MSNFVLRKTKPEDSSTLNALYRKYTGIERSHEQFVWEWFQGPYGPAPSWVVVETNTDNVVAHHGVIPCPLWHKGRSIKAARTENSMVDPAYRDKVLYVSYEAMLLKRLLDEFEIVFTTTGKGTPGAIRKRLGYRSVGHWHSFVIHEPPAYLAARFTGRLAGQLVSALTLPQSKQHSDWSLEPTRDCERVAALWTCSRNAYSFAPQREENYLKWRLVDNPYYPAQLAIATKEGQDFGFVAWRQHPSDHAGIEISIEDIFCMDNEASSYRAVLTLMRKKFHRVPTRLILRTLHVTNALCAAATSHVPRRLKSMSQNSGAELLIRTQEPSTFPIPDLTMLITEGID